MSSIGQLTVTLGLDDARFQAAIKRSDSEANRFTRNFVVNLDNATQKAKSFSDRTTQYLKNIEATANNLNSTVRFEAMANHLNRLTAAANQFVQISDRHTELSNKLKLVTDGERQHAQAMADVYAISLKTAQATEATSSVYQTFAQNAEQLKLAQNDVSRLTEVVAKSVAVSGASSAAASNALIQFSQSLMTGKMRAQEFNSLMTQTPSLVQAIAKGLGITTGELKAMVDKGEMSAEKMIEGLKKAENYVNNQYSKTAVTISGAMQNLVTSTQQWIGEMDNAAGVSSGAASAINALASNFSTLAPLLLSVGAAFAAIRLKEFTTNAYAQITATRQQSLAIIEKTRAKQVETQKELDATRAYIASLQAQLNLTRVESTRSLLSQELQVQTARETALIQAKATAVNTLATASRSANMLSGAMSMLGGPLGLVAMGLTTGASLLFSWHQEAEQARAASLSYADSLDVVRENLTNLTTAQTEAELVKLSRSIREQEKALEDLKVKQAELNQELQQGGIILEDAFAGTMHVKRSAEELAKTQEELKLVTADVEAAQQKLNESLQMQHDLQAHIPAANLKDELVKLLPFLDDSQIKVDGLNVSIGNFSLAIPAATSGAFGYAGALNEMAKTALIAAAAVMSLNAANAEAVNPKLNAHIDNNNALIDIANAKAKGDKKTARELQAKYNANNKASGLGIDLNSDAGRKQFEQLQSSELKLLEAQELRATTGKKTGGGGVKKDKKQDVDRYNNQVEEMTQRLAGLKANAADISAFGKVSDYQEVKKLTNDIALNGEKYKSYSEAGVQNLKDLAAQLDAAQQQVAIAQFGQNQNDKIKSMELEILLMGKTRQEQELLQYGYKLDQEAAKIKIGMTEANIAKMDEEIAKIKEAHAAMLNQQQIARSSTILGIKEGVAEIEADVSDVASNVSNMTQTAFNGMADSLTDFLMTGKSNFREFAVSILHDIGKMIIKFAIFQSLKQGMGLMGFSDGGLVGGSFATGGYTGDGGKYTPAGIVHKGEYVITKEATARLGLDYLNYLNYGKMSRGFSNGGGVAVPRVPSTPTSIGGAATSNNVSITVNIDNNGAAQSDVETQADQGKQLGQLIQSKVLEVISREKRVGGLLAR